MTTALASNTEAFYIQQGTTAPPIEATLTDVRGVAVDIGASQVRFQAVRTGQDTLAIDAAATIVDAALGKVAYTFQPADTLQPGVLSAWWTLDGQAYPNSEPYIAVIVVARRSVEVQTHVTVEQLRDYLPQLPPSPAIDTVLGRILERSQRIVLDAIGAGVVYGAYQAATPRRVRSFGSEYLPLMPHNPGSVSSVVYGTVTVDTTGFKESDEGNLIGAEGAAYPLSPVWFGGSAWSPGWYSVVAEWGAGPMPPSVQQVVLELAVNIWRGKDKGLFTEIIGGESSALQYTGGLNKQQQMIIANEQRRLRIGTEVVI